MRDFGKRKTRGVRMNQLVGEEKQEDDSFWNQEAFQEKDDDDEFNSSDESSDTDSVDTDFDDPEVDEVLEVDEAEEKKMNKKPKNKSKYIDPAKLRSRPKLMPKEPRIKKPTPEVSNVNRVITMRASTADKVAISKIRRQLDDEEKEFCTHYRRVTKKKKRYTQNQMIQEAVRNEAVNKRSLEIMLNYEEAAKQQAPPIKRLATESNIRYYSKKGYPTTITFENMTEYPSIFREHNSVSYAEPLKCVITGKIAHYRDPTTGEPYYDLAAYKELIRRREEMKVIFNMKNEEKNTKATGFGFSTNNNNTLPLIPS